MAANPKALRGIARTSIVLLLGELATPLIQALQAKTMKLPKKKWQAYVLYGLYRQRWVYLAFLTCWLLVMLPVTLLAPSLLGVVVVLATTLAAYLFLFLTPLALIGGYVHYKDFTVAISGPEEGAPPSEVDYARRFAFFWHEQQIEDLRKVFPKAPRHQLERLVEDMGD